MEVEKQEPCSDLELDIKEEPEFHIKEEPQELSFHIVTVKTEPDQDGTSDTEPSEDSSQDQADEKNKESTAVYPPDPGPFSCSVCGHRSKKKTDLKRHMSSVHGEWTHKCPVCEKNFILKLHLLKHMKSHTQEKPFVCSVCDEGFGNSTSLSVHQTRAHHICRVCSKPVTESLDKHLKGHRDRREGEKPLVPSEESRDPCPGGHGPFSRLDHKAFICAECGRSFQYHSQVKRHVLCVHSEERPHSCSVCGKTFSLKCNLKAHMRSHGREKPYSCSVCGGGFETWFAHSQHRRLIHFICPVCSGIHKDTRSLDEHLKSHNERKNLDARIKSYAEKKALDQQLENHAEKKGSNEDLKRDVEKKDLTERLTSNAQSKRLKVKPESVKPFGCTECGQSFRSMFQLQSHMSDHTRERLQGQGTTRAAGEDENKDRGFKAQCPVCEKVLMSTYLPLHLQRVHFMCPLCPERFPDDEGRLQEHLKSHEEVMRPFSCSECGQRFGVTSHLQRHLKSHRAGARKEPGLRTLAPRAFLTQGALLVRTGAGFGSQVAPETKERKETEEEENSDVNIKTESDLILVTI